MARRYDLVVAGAGMAGLVAAVQAVERGAAVLVLEKGDRPGGSMRLSSGFVWRYRDWERFRAECPAGDEECSGWSGSGSMKISLGSTRSVRRFASARPQIC